MSWTNAKLTPEELIAHKAAIVLSVIFSCLMRSPSRSDRPKSIQHFLNTWLLDFLLPEERHTLQKYRELIGFEKFKAEFYVTLTSSGIFKLNNSGIPILTTIIK